MRENILKEHPEALLKLVMDNADHIIVIFDTDLNYILVNNAACTLLHKRKEELEGKNLLELFPNLTASKSHRHLLHAISGETVLDVTSEGTFTREGAKYISSYYPFKSQGAIRAILVITKKQYFPEA